MKEKRRWRVEIWLSRLTCALMSLKLLSIFIPDFLYWFRRSFYLGIGSTVSANVCLRWVNFPIFVPWNVAKCETYLELHMKGLLGLQQVCILNTGLVILTIDCCSNTVWCICYWVSGWFSSLIVLVGIYIPYFSPCCELQILFILVSVICSKSTFCYFRVLK